MMDGDAVRAIGEYAQGSLTPRRIISCDGEVVHLVGDKVVHRDTSEQRKRQTFASSAWSFRDVLRCIEDSPEDAVVRVSGFAISVDPMDQSLDGHRFDLTPDWSTETLIEGAEMAHGMFVRDVLTRWSMEGALNGAQVAQLQNLAAKVEAKDSVATREEVTTRALANGPWFPVRMRPASQLEFTATALVHFRADPGSVRWALAESDLAAVRRGLVAHIVDLLTEAKIGRRISVGVGS